jgi:hypothetical protein
VPPWLDAIGQRLVREDSFSAQKDVTELANLYESTPAGWFPVTLILSKVNMERADTAELFKPIIPTLLAHLSNSNASTRQEALRILSSLRPAAPFEILEPAIKMTYAEDAGYVYRPLRVAALFCKQSKQAVFAMRDAAAADQPAKKRVLAFMTIGEAARRECKDSELVDAVLQGLQCDPVEQVEERKPYTVQAASGPQTGMMIFPHQKNPDEPDVLDAAISATSNFNFQEAKVFKKDLQRLAADHRYPVTVGVAQLALKQIEDKSQ